MKAEIIEEKKHEMQCAIHLGLPLTEKEKIFYLLYIATKEERSALLNMWNQEIFKNDGNAGNQEV